MNESVEHPRVAINDATSQETKVMIDQNYNKMLQKTQIQTYLLENHFLNNFAWQDVSSLIEI